MLQLNKLSETAQKITLGWAPVPGAVGYRFQSSTQAPKWSHTFDPSRSQVTFSKADWYKVEALAVEDAGQYPGTTPSPGSWFGIADPWAGVPFGSRPEGPATAPGGAIRLSGDLGGRKIGGFKITNRPPGVNVIAIEYAYNFTLEDIDFENVPIGIYLYGCRDFGIRRLRARNIFGPFYRGGIHSGNLVQAVNCDPPSFCEDWKLQQLDTVPTAPGTYDPNHPGYWGTEDCVSMFGTCHDWKVQRIALNGGAWQSWSGTGLLLGDDGRSNNLQLDQFVLVNPGRVGIGFHSSNCKVTNGRIWSDARRFNSQVDGRQIESVTPIEVAGVQQIQLGNINSRFLNGSGAPARPMGSFTDLGGNDWAASLNRDELRAICRV